MSHQGITCALSPGLQVHLQHAGGGSDLHTETDTDAVKGEFRVNPLVDRGGWSPLFTPPPLS